MVVVMQINCPFDCKGKVGIGQRQQLGQHGPEAPFFGYCSVCDWETPLFHTKEAVAKYVAGQKWLTRLRDGLDGMFGKEPQLRPCLASFAIEMEERLAANEHKGGWDNLTLEQLYDRLAAELSELVEAIGDFNKGNSHLPEAARIMFHIAAAHHVAHEAADVSNFAMMIANRALESVKQGDNPRGEDVPL